MMSALPPKRTFAVAFGTSAKCQKRTFRPPFAMSASPSIAKFRANLGNRPIFMKKVRCCVSDLTYEVAARPIHYRQYESPCARLKGRQMSREIDSGRIEQVIMLAGLALFLVLATVIPA